MAFVHITCEGCLSIVKIGASYCIAYQPGYYCESCFDALAARVDEDWSTPPEVIRQVQGFCVHGSTACVDCGTGRKVPPPQFKPRSPLTDLEKQHIKLAASLTQAAETFKPSEVKITFNGKELKGVSEEAISYGDWVSVKVGAVKPEPKCDCGAASVGAQAFKPGHSDWCAVAEGKR